MHISDWSSNVCSSDLIVRRKQFKTSKEVRFSNIQINLDQRLVAVSGNQVNLTKKEYAILTHLISNRKRILSKVARSEERRVGKECVSPCSSRWSLSHLHKMKKMSSIQSLRYKK